MVSVLAVDGGQPDFLAARAARSRDQAWSMAASTACFGIMLPEQHAWVSVTSH